MRWWAGPWCVGLRVAMMLAAMDQVWRIVDGRAQPLPVTLVDIDTEHARILADLVPGVADADALAAIRPPDRASVEAAERDGLLDDARAAHLEAVLRDDEDVRVLERRRDRRQWQQLVGRKSRSAPTRCRNG